jgi:hypothetical protein
LKTVLCQLVFNPSVALRVGNLVFESLKLSLALGIERAALLLRLFFKACEPESINRKLESLMLELP